MKHVYHATSKIDGLGVFAGEDIKTGEVIQPIRGKMKFYAVKTKKDSQAYPDWIGVGKNQWIDPEKPFKFINHSCSPNAGVKGKVQMTAIKDIKEGEEITLDYSIIEGDPMWEMPCNCGAPNCRKIIRSIQFIPESQFNKYLPYIPKYFQSLYYNHKETQA
jgi:SET domain-containing protein